MRVVSYVLDGDRTPLPWRVGVLLDEDVVLDAWLAVGDGPLPGAAGVLAWLDVDGPWWPALAAAVARARSDEGRAASASRGAIRALADVRLGAPVPRPGKVVTVGLNFRDHAAEAKLEVQPDPIIFAKYSSAVIGTGEPIVIPKVSRRVDYEAELVIVIGRRLRRAGPEEAAAAILGYTNGNDVSARDLQKRDGQWVRAKSCDTFAPMGPCLVTADEVPDPHALDITLSLNGTTLQHSNTREMIFPIPSVVSFISQTSTLEPGDVIFTGTPPGVGFARRPPVYLQPGDEVVVEIGPLGRLVNPVVAEE